MSGTIHRGVAAALLLCLASSSGAVEFQRRATLKPQDLPSGMQDRYGTVVAADGDTVAIAIGKRPGPPIYGGAVEVWVRRDRTWQRQDTLPVGASALALRGDRLLIGLHGGTGMARLYRRVGDRWLLEQNLTPDDTVAGDAFGYSVALQDGRALVGAPGHDGAAGENQGMVYVFEQRGLLWRASSRIEAPSAQAGDLLGASVAWSDDLALASAVGYDGPDRSGQGAVFGFARQGDAWTEAFTLTAADGEAGDSFGVALAADAQRLVVGAHLDDVEGRANAGSARVFLRAGDRFSPEATLVDAAADALGYAVSLSGDAIALGSNAPAPAVFRLDAAGWQRATSPEAPSDDAVETVAIAGPVLAMGAPRTDVGQAQDRGIAVIAVQDGDGWDAQALLTSEDAPPSPTTFGWALDIDQGRAVIGAPGMCAGFCPPTVNVGAAHFFEIAPNGDFDSKQFALGLPSGYGDGYAHAVSLRGDRALVAGGGGSDWLESPTLDVFERKVGGYWRRVAQLSDAQGQPIEASHVAIDGDIAVAGNRFDLHLFHREADGQWRHEVRFPAGLRGAYALSALVLQGDTVAVGISSFSSEAENQGIVYVLVRRNGRWELDARLLGDALPHSGFGEELALHGNHLLVGESGAYGPSPGGGVLAYERTAAGWQSRGRLAVPKAERWHAGVAVHGDIAFAFARNGSDAAVHAFQFRGGTWQPAGRQAAAGPRLAFDGATLLVAQFGLNLNSAQEVEVFSIRR
jgi:hypothetical protein